MGFPPAPHVTSPAGPRPCDLIIIIYFANCYSSRSCCLICSLTQKPVHAHNECNLLPKAFSFWVNLGVLPTFTLPLPSGLWRGLVDQRVLKYPMIWSDLFIPEGLKVSYFAHLSSSLTAAIKDLWFTAFPISFTTWLSSPAHQGSQVYLLGAQYHIQYKICTVFSLF